MNRKAEMGMGTLIIFIAMILVAAVAAGVLISTTSSLQNKALATGRATTQEVGTSIVALSLIGEDGTGQRLTYLYETVKLSAGSDAIRFNDTLLTLNLENNSQDYAYDRTINCSDVATFALGSFGAQYQITGTNNKTGYLTKGDVVKLCFESPQDVTEGKKVKVTLVPMVGQPLMVDTSSPDLMVTKTVTLFP
jgi:flagellin FlaB